MAVRERYVDEACGIAHASAVMGDWWSLLVLREIARGHRRFDELVGELGVSRKVLTERLAHLTEHGVLRRALYQSRPPRHEYELSGRGLAFLPVLVAMQDWADRWLLGNGELTATAEPAGAEAARTRALVGSRIPDDVRLTARDGSARDPVATDAVATVLFTYPGTGRPTPHPAGWNDIPGTIGCTLENRLFRDRWADFVGAGATVVGVSTQRPEEQAAFARAEKIPFPLLSDVDLHLAAALRLPCVRIAQQPRLKRLVVVVDARRVVRQAIFPITDIPAAVEDALSVVRDLSPRT
jgi:DNA-binding HxlR family transcriptional regulator/peroxiredoxin